jgi:hypothetical protein
MWIAVKNHNMKYEAYSTEKTGIYSQKFKFFFVFFFFTARLVKYELSKYIKRNK